MVSHSKLGRASYERVWGAFEEKNRHDSKLASVSGDFRRREQTNVWNDGSQR